MRWTKETAEKFVASYIGKGRFIILDGTMSLKKCSASDYLVKEHGYLFRVEGSKS